MVKLAASCPPRLDLLGDCQLLNVEGVRQEPRSRLETFSLSSPIGCAGGSLLALLGPLRGDAQRKRKCPDSYEFVAHIL